MVTKTHKSGAGSGDSADPRGRPDLSGTVKDSAQQIWLAGLGAFAKAQEEGSKVFDALVKEGAALQRKTQSAAEEKFSEATSRMASMATDITAKASGQWGKLEDIFEERVARALRKLGVPAANEIDALNARIDALERGMARTRAKPAGVARPAGAAKPSRKRPAAKKSA